MTGPPESKQVLHIPTGERCNNRCTFCMERNAGYPLQYSLEEYRATLDKMRAELSGVVFTGGEPTLNPLLPRLVEMATELGYELVGLVSNGRALKDPKLCERLLEGGLNQLTVSLHGPRAEIHDAISRSKGSFDQAARCLSNFARLRERYEFELKVNCILVQSNLAHMGEMGDFASSFGVDNLNFNVAEPRGSADELFATVMPRYAEVMDQADRSGLDFKAATQSLSRVPACAGGVEWVQETWHLAHSDRVDVYDPDEGKTKGQLCDSCAINAQCTGIWQRYIEGYGWDELVAVVDPQERRGETLRILTGSACNNHCVHCIDGPVASEAAAAKPVGRQLREGHVRGYRRVELAGGEVLLSDWLPALVKQARDLGFQEVVLETNGRMLNLAATSKQLRELGLAEVVVRLNAGDENANDEMARVKGAFRQTVRGLLQLAKHSIPFAVRVRKHERNSASLDRARQLALQAGAIRFEVVE